MMTPDQTNNNQEKAVGNAQPKPFDPKDTDRIAELEKKFSPALKNEYVVGGATVEITGNALVNKVAVAQDGGYEQVGQKREPYTIELPVTITDPKAPGDFKNVGRYSKYVLTVDKITGEVMSSSRIDRRFDEKQNQYNFDGPIYQINRQEADELLKTKAVTDVMSQIRG